MSTPAPPFFNILVPTKNRADTLRFCLRSLLAQQYSNLAIIVSDNCSADGTRKVVEEFSDPRLRHVDTGKPLSMRENWEFALKHVESGWVSFLGDDDGLAPNALERVADVIRATGVSAVTSAWCRYTWPGDLAHANKLVLPLGHGTEIRQSKAWRRRVLSGAWRYIELPYVYTGGFVEYRILQKALAQKNTFFNSINPDIYSAMAISFLVDEYAYLKDSIAVRGTSAHSTGASSFNGSANNAPKQAFLSENARAMHPLLQAGEFPMSAHLFVYEAYLQASFLGDESTRRESVADLDRQLRIVEALAGRKDRPDVKRYTARIRAKAGPSPQARTSRLWPLVVRPLYFLVELKRVLGSALIDTASLGVRDVYAAGLLVRDIEDKERARPFRRIRRIWSTAQVYLRRRARTVAPAA